MKIIPWRPHDSTAAPVRTPSTSVAADVKYTDKPQKNPQKNVRSRISAFRQIVGQYWRPVLGYLAAITAVTLVLGYRLTSLTHGANDSEAATQTILLQRSLHLTDIFRSPQYLAYQLGLYTLEKLHLYSLLALRAVSVFFGALCVGIFYVILHNWYNRRIAVFGTVLFLFSGWFLHTARSGMPEILLVLSVETILLCGVLQQKYRNRSWPYTTSIVLCSLTLFNPGMIWVVATGCIWHYKRIIKLLRSKHPRIILSLVVGLIIVSPLFIAIAREPRLIFGFAGLPTAMPSAQSLFAGVKAIAALPLYFVFRTHLAPTYQLGHLPLLDAFSGVFLLFGLYSFALHWRLKRSKALAEIAVICAILFGLSSIGGNAGLALFIPIIYLGVGSGIAWFLQQWFIVFPRNPLARGLGTTMLCLALFLIVFYHSKAYFVAWPAAPETRNVFSHL